METPSLYPELDEQLDIIDTDPEAAESSGMFTVDSLDKANWALSTLAKRDADLAEKRAAAERMQQRIADWIVGEERRHEQHTAFLRGQLERYHRERLDTDPTAKTLHFPAGELRARKAPDQWAYTDEAEFLRWAEANGREDLIRRRDPEPDRAAVKKALNPAVAEVDVPRSTDVPVWDPETGEAVPGISVTPGTVRFTARPHIDGGGWS